MKKYKVLHMCLNLGGQAKWGGGFHPKLTFGSQVEAACAQSKPTNWIAWWHVMQNKLVKLMFFSHSESNWSPYTLILCCSYKQGFHENQLQGEQKRKSSQEDCIVITCFPGASYAHLVVENYSLLGSLPDFSLAGSDFFTTLNTWGQGSFS